MSLNFRNWLEDKAPDYSFDRFVKSAEDLKKTKDSLVGAAKEKEAELDKDIDDKKKEVDVEKDKPEFEPEQKPEQKPDPKHKPEPEKDQKDPVKFDDNQKQLLNKLRQIAKERSDEKKK